jgi:hypothetical protein
MGEFAMRLSLRLGILLGLAFASPAAAQSPGFRQQIDLQMQTDMLRAQQDLAARQQLLQQNELFRLEAQQRTQQSLSDLQAQTRSPQLAPPPASGPYLSIDVSGLASIPDAALAASNARVRAAAENRP